MAGSARARARWLFLAGGMLFLAGAATLVVAAAIGGREAGEDGATTSTSFTMGTAPGATFPGAVGGDETTATATTLPGETTSTPGGDETTPTPTAPTAPSGSSNDQRLSALSRQVRFALFSLQDPAWQLDQLTSGQSAAGGYVALVYRRGAQYVSISQEPRTGTPDIPNAVDAKVGTSPGRLVNMGTVVLIGWNAQGTGITLSTDVDQATALALAAKVLPVK